MSLPRSCRVPLACSLALGLVSMASAAPASEGASSASRLCSAEAKASASQGLALYDTGAGLRLMDVPAADLAAELDGSLAKSGAENCALKATAANLSVKFPGQVAALTAGGVSFFNPSKTLDVLDPVLCHSYANAGLTMALGDTNGAVQTVQGWESIRYDLGSRQVIPTSLKGDSGPLAYCFSFPYTSLVSDPTEFPPAAGNADGIFRGRFESQGDLRVEMLADDTLNTIRRLNVTAGYEFSYKLRVTNVGEGTVAGVAVHEYVPQDAGALVQPVVDGGSWTCQRENAAACSTASGNGEIHLTGQMLAPGQSLTFRITRTVPAGTPGEQTLLAAAAFVDPSHASGGGEEKYEDNDASLVVKLLDNQPPTIACVDQAQAALATPVAMGEDGAARTFTCTVTDSDEIDTVASFAVTGSSSFGPLQSFAAVDGTAGDGIWTFTLTPKADEFGTANIVLRATDNRGAARDLGFAVNVASVNDAPSFDTYATTIVLSPTGAVPTDENGAQIGDAGAHFPTRGPECTNGANDACSISIGNFFEFVDAGPANEVAQTVEANLLNCTSTAGGTVLDMFMALPTASPAGAQASGSHFALGWTYSKSVAQGTTISCEASFVDSGGTSSLPVTITFIMGPLPPP